jgi:hypothetical protein
MSTGNGYRHGEDTIAIPQDLGNRLPAENEKRTRKLEL